MIGLNKWLAVILGAVAAVGISGAQGYRMGKASVIASQAQAQAVRMETLHLAQLAAAEEIAKIQIRHTTIRQTAEQVIREVPIYRDCRNSPDIVGLLDSARENRDIAAGDRSVPRTGAGESPDFRRRRF
jgi:hypothetical protein